MVYSTQVDYFMEFYTERFSAAWKVVQCSVHSCVLAVHLHELKNTVSFSTITINYLIPIPNGKLNLVISITTIS